MDGEGFNGAEPGASREFTTTHWSVVLAAGQQESPEAGKADLFERLRLFLVGGQGETTYAEVATEPGMATAAVKKTAQRMRHRYYALFRQEIAQTVADPAEVKEEMRHLCAVIAG